MRLAAGLQPFTQPLQPALALARARQHRSPAAAADVLLWVAFGVVLLGIVLAEFSGGYHGGFAALNALANAWLPAPLWGILTRFGETQVLLALGLLLARRRPEVFWALLLAAVFGALYSRGLKPLIDAVRPPGVLEPGSFVLVGPGFRSHAFPSGHTLSVFVFAGVLAVSVSQVGLRVLILALAALIGCSRVAVGVHWPQDVIAGAFGGLLAAWLGLWLARRWTVGLRPGVHLAGVLLAVLGALVMLVTDGGMPWTSWVFVPLGLVVLLHAWHDYWPHGKLTLLRPGQGWPLIAALLILGLAAYRFWVIGLIQLPLDLEEAYYLYWSTQPDLGYFSKPPMIAWLLWLVSELAGMSEQAIKLASIVLHTATAWLVYRIGRRLFSPAMGLAAAVVFQSLPIVGLVSLFTTTDALLLFFWALTLWAFVMARDTNAWRWWLLTGLAGGLGLLSKYPMGMLAIGLAGYVLSSRTTRGLLTNARLWVAVGVAAALLAPNLWWNLQHGFITFGHTAHITGVGEQWLYPAKLAEFWAGQWVAFGLLLMPPLVLLLIRPATWRHEAYRLLAWASLPLFLLVSVQALVREANPNWASPAMIGFAILVTGTLWAQRRRWLMIGVAFNLLLLSVLYHYHAIAAGLGIELDRGSSPYQKRLGWRELGYGVGQWLEAHPEARLLSHKRDLLAYVGYYAGPWPPRVASWNPSGRVNSQYDLTDDLTRYPEETFLYLSPAPLALSTLEAFARWEYLGVQRVPVFADLERVVHGYLLRDFRGYGVGRQP